MRELAKKIGGCLLDFFSEEENPDEPQYDPVHAGAVIVVVLLALTVLFWLLWALLVFGGGIQSKLVPFIAVAFTGRTLRDYGYVGYPYEMGVFEGWLTNLAALIISAGVLIALWHIFSKAKTMEDQAQ
jgi:hypothetical protein